MGRRQLTSLVVPSPVETIGKCAFAQRTGLTSITLPDTLTSIERLAFRRCHALPSLTLPNSVTTIGDCAFSECARLTSLTLPLALTSVGKAAFEGCSPGVYRSPNRARGVIIPPGYCSRGGQMPPHARTPTGAYTEILFLALPPATGLSVGVLSWPCAPTPRPQSWERVVGPTAHLLTPTLTGRLLRAVCLVARGSALVGIQKTTVSNYPSELKQQSANN